MSWPQQKRRLVVRRAQVWELPPLTAIQLVAPPATWTGMGWLAVIGPLPSWPELSLPQQKRRPELRTAHVWRLPAVTVVQLVAPPATGVGVDRLAMVALSPSWPEKSYPQQ